MCDPPAPMHVTIEPAPLAGSAVEDFERSQVLLDGVARGEIPSALRIWTPVPTLALSRLDELRPGIGAARAAAERAGFTPLRRLSGGHAVALGAGSLCVGLVEPAPTFEGTQARYERMVAAVLGALRAVGIEAEQGELDGEWCPGAWSIRTGAVKLAGLAQRAVRGAAWVDAVIALRPDAEAAALLPDVYAALDLPLDPRTVGSVSEVVGREVAFDELADPLREALAQ